MDQNKTIKGYSLAFLSVIIWAGWLIASRIGVKAHLTPPDMIFLRFFSAGLIMLPIALKNRQYLNRQNLVPIITMSMCMGPAYNYFAFLGFQNAPAAHGILTPSTMTADVALLSYIFYKERITTVKLLGYGLIICGVLFRLTNTNGIMISDCFFLTSGFLWAIFTVIAKRYRHIPALVLTSYVTVGSMLIVTLPYALYQLQNPHSLNIKASIIQIIYQAIFTSIISLIAYIRAMVLIGAAQASSLAALVPVMATLMAIPLLNELPTNNDLILVAFMTCGVFLASGVLKVPSLRGAVATRQSKN